MATFIKVNHHLTLDELHQEERYNRYLSKISPEHRYFIRAYPRPEICATHLSHSTDLTGLKGVCNVRGFRDPFNSSGLVWFSLTVTPEDLSDAETRNMKIVHPGEREEAFTEEGYRAERGLLTKFASSPVFLSSSRYGSYRFTFDLRDVLDRYSEQFCDGRPPVMRKWKTELYKQEVMYVVLVHSPDDPRFSQHPLLVEDEHSICAFREEPEPHFIWRPQAMCGTHRFELIPENNTLSAYETHDNYYVWDHVTLALVVDDKDLHFTGKNLRRSLRFCEEGDRPIHFSIQFQSYDDANRAVQELWPDSGDLEKSPVHVPVQGRD